MRYRLDVTGGSIYHVLNCLSMRHAGKSNLFLFPLIGIFLLYCVAFRGCCVRNLVVTSYLTPKPVDNLSTAFIEKENIMKTKATVTNPIILTHASTDTWGTNEGDVFTSKRGEFYNRIQNSSAYALSTGTIALGISERVFDIEANRLESEVAWANIFVSREHARLFALEILAELDRTENN